MESEDLEYKTTRFHLSSHVYPDNMCRMSKCSNLNIQFLFILSLPNGIYLLTISFIISFTIICFIVYKEKPHPFKTTYQRVIYVRLCMLFSSVAPLAVISYNYNQGNYCCFNKNATSHKKNFYLL